MRENVMKEKQDRDVRKNERRPMELEGSLGCRQEENETQNKRVHNSKWKYKRTWKIYLIFYPL